MRVPWIAPTTTAEIMFLLAYAPITIHHHSGGATFADPCMGNPGPFQTSDAPSPFHPPPWLGIGSGTAPTSSMTPRHRVCTGRRQCRRPSERAVRVSPAHHFFSWRGISLLEVSDPPSKPRYNTNVCHFISTSITFGLQAFVLFTPVQSSIVQCMLS
jgi:hypothetical protein